MIYNGVIYGCAAAFMPRGHTVFSELNMLLRKGRNELLFIPQGTPKADSDLILELYTKYKSLLYAVALKYAKSKDDCEDVIQDAVIRLLNNVGTLRTLQPEAIPTYLSLTVRSAALNWNKHQEVVNAHTSDLSPEDADSLLGPERLHNDMDARLLSGELSDSLYRAMKRLSERDQLLLMGKYYIGLDNRELKDMVGCKADSVRMLLTRAKRALIAELEKEGIVRG